MDLRAFLRAVTPSTGFLVAARKVLRQEPGGRVYPAFSHTVYETHDQMAAGIERADAEAAGDCYFALASFTRGFHPSAAGKKVVRVRSNVAALRALWLDIDFKDGYAGAPQAVAAVVAFCEATKLPKPSIVVGSGNGIHVYWPLDADASPDEWQGAASALRQVGEEYGLKADWPCTADACRVLRPPGTTNRKDPANPKPVKILFASGVTHPLSAFSGASSLGTVPAYLRTSGGDVDPYAAGVGDGAAREPSRFEPAAEKCAVLDHIRATKGREQTEPEWSATLQVLKHFDDGDAWVHPLSEGHPAYNAEDTAEKWRTKLENSSGPTLCSTFEVWHPSRCAVCPHRGNIKTPVALGRAPVASAPPPQPGTPAITLNSWRPCPNGDGMERRMLDPNTNQYTWEKVLRRTISTVVATRSVVSRQYELSFAAELKGSKPIEIALPATYLGNQQKLKETMAGFGAPLMANEVMPFITLMGTWLEKLQARRAVDDVTEQLGWIENADSEQHELIGFAAGPTSYYTDGTTRNGVRTAKEFAAVAKLYVPHGKPEAWKEVAKFLAKQNNPAFMAVLASAFASPLLPFTGVSGGILSLVSRESGVGKSSAMRAAQAVWGSPTHGMNSVDDTRLSVARKLGFLRNLPAYWDELRGKKTLEDFMVLAYQVTQGKEKTRLDSSASMREVNTWQTMLIAASNESIFEYMSKSGGGSDAGIARTFEITVDPFESEKARAEVAVLFSSMDGNYGWAGQEYAKYLANNLPEVRARVEHLFTTLGMKYKMRPAERFWFAIIASLVAGAEFAGKAGLVEIDVPTLAGFLVRNVNTLRGRSTDVMSGSGARELLAAYLQDFQNDTLVMDYFVKAGQRTDRTPPPRIISPPKSGKMLVNIAEKDKRVRVMRGHFTSWLRRTRDIFYNSVRQQFRDELHETQSQSLLGGGTPFALPRSYVIELDYDVLEGTGGESE